MFKTTSKFMEVVLLLHGYPYLNLEGESWLATRRRGVGGGYREFKLGLTCCRRRGELVEALK